MDYWFIVCLRRSLISGTSPLISNPFPFSSYISVFLAFVFQKVFWLSFSESFLNLFQRVSWLLKELPAPAATFPCLQIEALVDCGVAHVVLAVSYQADQLEQEMQVLSADNWLAGWLAGRLAGCLAGWQITGCWTDSWPGGGGQARHQHQLLPREGATRHCWTTRAS